MGYIKSPDGGFILEDDQFELFYDNLGRKGLRIVGASTDNTELATKKYVDDIEHRVKGNEDLLQALNDEIKDCKTELTNFKTRVSDVEEAFPTKLTLTGGTMEGNIDMNSYSITDVQKLHIDGVAPVYIGSVIEQSGTQGVRLTGTTAGEAAFVKPDTQNTYAPVFGADPTSANHLATKQYVDSENNKMKETMNSFKLPDYSVDNNGYVLMIQNGVPTWVKMS